MTGWNEIRVKFLQGRVWTIAIIYKPPYLDNSLDFDLLLMLVL
ncbi:MULTISPECIES: hypothetical protein [Fischerella]|nr:MULTISPECIES: hypothetical protein [Fischerella]